MEKDERFAHIRTDPKFRPVRKFKPKTKIDNRFQSMFKDKSFKVKYKMDKRGRPIDHNSTKALKDFYNISSDESDDNEEEIEIDTKLEPPKDDSREDSDQKESGDENNLDKPAANDKTVTKEIKKKLHDLSVDYARGEGKLLSESSSDDDDSEEDANLKDADDEIEHKWGELDNDAESTEEATRRLAACNMDWDRIRAIDLMVLFNSFLPPGGVIESVAIFPSEYGKKRMQEEDIKGPSELVQTGDDEEEDGEETEEGAKYHMEKLRQYQLNRLKYYYAVVTFDSATAANKIYTECDGMEYESSSTKIDLRFIPDDMIFDDKPKEICDKLPEVNKYQPRFFTTTALQQAKVDLTWDETDPERIEIIQKLSGGKIDDINESDLHNYLAVSSSDEENVDDDNNKSADEENDDNSNPIEKYKKLLQDIEDKEQRLKDGEVEMEVTWGTGLEAKAEEFVKKRLEENEEKTPFQKYLDKRKEKRKEKKNKAKNESEKKLGDENSSDEDLIPSDVDLDDPYFAEEFKNNTEFQKKNLSFKKTTNKNEETNPELELLLMNEEEDLKKNHFSLSKIQKGEKLSSGKKKRKNKTEENKQQDEFEVNVNDSRFSALFTSHLYNIDPSDPHFKKTKAMETLISEKLRRRNIGEVEESKTEQSQSKNKNAELSVLVKSVKRKTEAIIGNNYKKKNKR